MLCCVTGAVTWGPEQGLRSAGARVRRGGAAGEDTLPRHARMQQRHWRGDVRHHHRLPQVS